VLILHVTLHSITLDASVCSIGAVCNASYDLHDHTTDLRMFVLIGTYLLALLIAPHGMCSMVLGLDIKQLRTVENKPCKSAPRSRQITTPAPHHSVFYRPDALPVAQPTASKH